MELLHIPEEVIEAKLLKYLSWNDLLRLRHVCNETLRITNGYLKVNPNRAPEIEINPKTGKTFAAFMAMGIPTTKIFLNNPFGYHFYDDSDEYRRQFMDRYGPVVKHLRVTQLTMWPLGNELDFLESLVNIRSVEASHFGWNREINSPPKQEQLVKQAMTMTNWRLFHDAYPLSFKNLESIRIGENPENEVINKLKITGETFIHCQKLKKAALPFTWTGALPRPGPQCDLRGSLMGEFYFLNIYMEPRPNDVYSEQGRLELYDFIQCHDDVGGWDEWRTRATIPVHWHASLDFLPLLKTALETGLRFANVSPYWFYARDAKNGRFNGKELGIPVVSLRGIHPMMMTMEMPNLEKIVIPHTSRCVGVAEGKEKPDWPALKSLEINVDDCLGCAWCFNRMQELQPYTMHTMMSIKGLWGTLFKGVVRVNMAELTLTFEEEGRRREDGGKGSVPSIEEIVGACPNLKRVKLGNWPGKNKQLLKLWEGLRGLEEVELEACREVGNVTFVGEETDKPVFFKLKNLKKLTLKGLDKMPKITDLLFETVLAQMNLKELVLTSDKPVEKVTKEGIAALLEGPFAETIEKFPFRNWSMAGVCAEEFQEMEKKFRPYNLI